jgi:hypothetical protein
MQNCWSRTSNIEHPTSNIQSTWMHCGWDEPRWFQQGGAGGGERQRFRGAAASWKTRRTLEASEFGRLDRWIIRM